jgi:hypothetical protein
MKIEKYDLIFKIQKKSGPHKRRRQLSRRVSRAKLIKAFAVPGVGNNAAKEIVARYIGTSPVPPRWNSLGVKGTFGKKIQSLWARRISCLPAATYKSENNRNVFPIVQTIHEMQKSTKKSSQVKNTSGTFIMDEFWQYSQPSILLVDKLLNSQR